MKKLIDKAQCLLGLILLFSWETQANIPGGNGEELYSSNESSSGQYLEEVELKTKAIRADDLKFYRTYVEGSICDIEISNPDGSYEIVLRDSDGNICEKYNSDLVAEINMNEVSNGTLPLIQTSNIDGRDKVTGTVRVSDLIDLVRKRARGGEEIQVHPMESAGSKKNSFESAQWFNWGNFTQNNFGNFGNQY